MICLDEEEDDKEIKGKEKKKNKYNGKQNRRN